MLRTITASVCLHPIRSSSELPHSVNGIDFAIRYCGPCAKSREIAAENEAAILEVQRLTEAQDPDGDRQALRAAQIRCDKAHLAHVEDRKRQAERAQAERGVPPHDQATEGSMNLELVPESSMRRRPKKGLTARFDMEEYYRPEEEYRRQSQFDRTAADYTPGIHADESGNGFVNTSSPPASDSGSEISELGDQRGEKTSDEAMEDVFGYAENEDEDEDTDMTHVLSREEDDDDEEEDHGSEQEVLTREEILERTRVLQERIEELCARNSEPYEIPTQQE